MNSKLTLKLDSRVIEKAKVYARRKNTSLSKLVESYLQLLTSTSKGSEDPDVTPLVKSLSGVLDEAQLRDYEESYKKHLRKKYSK
jgi:hypothetical protein